jgi:hypothetical protein
MSEKAVPVRRSTRSNIGVQPKRFGNPVSSSWRKSIRKTPLQEVMSVSQNPSAPDLDELLHEPSQRQGVHEDNGSIYSRRSNGSAVSVSSSIRKLSKKIELQESIMVLKKKRMDLQKKNRIMEGELMIIESRVSSLLKKPVPEDDFEKKVQANNLSDLQQTLVEKRILMDVHRDNFDLEMEMLNEQEASMLKVQTFHTEMVDLENSEEQNLGSDDKVIPEMSQTVKKVQNWATEPSSATVKVKSVDAKVGAISSFMTRQIIKHDLPTFEGKFDEWPIFYSQYEMTTEACKITDVENIQRLQKALKGEAGDVVKCMLVSPHNVQRVMEILKRRYGRPKFILDAIIQQVESLPNLKGNDMTGLLGFMDAVRNLTKTAIAFDCQPYLCNPKLLGSLMKKLPEFRLMSWAHHLRQLRTEFPSLMDFSEWLEEVGCEVEAVYDPFEDRSELEKKRNVPGSWRSEEQSGFKRSPRYDYR